MPGGEEGEGGVAVEEEAAIFVPGAGGLMMDSSSPQKKHPSRGGNAYSQDMCEEVITRFQLGLPMNTPELTALRVEY